MGAGLKDLSYYLELPYEIRIRRRVDPVEGEIFVARVSELDGCMSHGKTPEEAVRDCHVALREWIEDAIEDGDRIPEPESEPKYSGRLLLRMPTFLHRKIAEGANAWGMSINQYVVHALSQFTTTADMEEKVAETLDKKLEVLTNSWKEFKWSAVRELYQVERRLFHAANTLVSVPRQIPEYRLAGYTFSGPANEGTYFLTYDVRTFEAAPLVAQVFSTLPESTSKTREDLLKEGLFGEHVAVG